MRENFTYGSVGRAPGNRCLYPEPHKLITFQKLRLEEENRIEFRLGYYMIGVKLGAKGRWVWGQYALMIPEKDFKVILKEAQKRKWF